MRKISFSRQDRVFCLDENGREPVIIFCVSKVQPQIYASPRRHKSERRKVGRSANRSIVKDDIVQNLCYTLLIIIE